MNEVTFTGSTGEVGQSLVGLVALPACQARVASCRMRQPRCRTSRACDPARVTPLTLPVTGMLCVLVTKLDHIT